MSVAREMPLYQCHKRVYALKIAEVLHNPNPDATGQSGASSHGARIVPAEEGYGAFKVDAAYVCKHNPQPGGYYVVYEDGYASFSPAWAFEGGYAPVPSQIEEQPKADFATVSGALSERWKEDADRAGRTAPFLRRFIGGGAEQPGVLTFGEALRHLKDGSRVARLGWNGRGQFVYFVPPASYPVQTGAATAHFGEGAMVPYDAYLALKTVGGSVSTWAPSVSDCLAEDWVVVPA